MGATYSQRELRRAERWVDQSGGLTYVPPEAFGLLLRRLAARRRARLWCTPFAVAFVGIFGWSGVETSRRPETLSWDQTFSGRLLAAYALLSVSMVVRDQLTNRAERRIGATLPHRVSRGTAVSVPMMLGPARMTFLVTAVTLEAAFAATLPTVGHGWLAWAFPLGFAVACGFVVVGVRQAATRATVASDPVSLTIDERLRSQDAFSATRPLIFLVVVLFMGSTNSMYGSGWLEYATKLGAVIIFALMLWGEFNGPGQPSSLRLDSFLARALRWVRP